jgi:hypothetical protein
MSTCVIDAIPLEPYSTERMILVSGYNCDEVIEWYKDAFGKPESNKLSDIKSFYKTKNEWIKFFEDNRIDLDGLDKDGGGNGNGVYIYRKSPDKNCKLRMVILKYGFSPTNPENMRTLAHEMLHVCQEFLSQFLDRDEEMEAEAYFHSYLMYSCYKLFL